MVLKLAYIGLTMVTILFLVFIGFKAINESSRSSKRDKIKLILGLLLWQIFILLVASTDILKSYEFPPLFVITFIIPSFIFTGVFLYLNRNKKWIQSIPEHWIIYFQSFRILVELLFVFSVAQGIFNPQVTIEGYNFDMVFAFTAPIIAFLTYSKKIITRKVVLIWNYLGLTVIASIIFLFQTTIYKPEIFGSEVPLLPLEALTYPYILIAAFLMPTAVFLHILSILQIKKTKSVANTVYSK
ncbi:conserved membrane hypothetical protein [Tenacibaculum sediminilitoris]|uniref:hypothetical protein n=1 Tax=Tenacibaculum sediminilitoris TaxID=1820334 RepID=UPI0038953191